MKKFNKQTTITICAAFFGGTIFALIIGGAIYKNLPFLMKVKNKLQYMRVAYIPKKTKGLTIRDFEKSQEVGDLKVLASDLFVKSEDKINGNSSLHVNFKKSSGATGFIFKKIFEKNRKLT
ncbi:MAG: hypothetical protein ACI9E5_001005, partial [Candidatus Omnitrophota bacterium]